MMIDDNNTAACPGCIDYFGRRTSDRFPTPEEYRAAKRLYPRPMYSTDEEATRASEDWDAFGEVMEAAQLRRGNLSAV